MDIVCHGKMGGQYMKQLNKVVVLMTMMVVIVSCKMNVFDIITDKDFKYWYRYNALDKL